MNIKLMILSYWLLLKLLNLNTIICKAIKIKLLFLLIIKTLSIDKYQENQLLIGLIAQKLF